MSRFQLIEIESKQADSFPDYDALDIHRKTEYRVLEHREDQYGNKYARVLMTTVDLAYAKSFIRSCRLIDGITIEG